MRRHIISVALACFFLLAFAVQVNAFGVAGSVNENTSPYIGYPGTEATIELRLQNVIGEEDVTVSAVMLDGAGVAFMQPNTYPVPYGEKNVVVPVTISIPEDVPVGEERTVIIHFETVADGETGGVGLGLGTNYRFKVIVAEEPQAQPPVEETPTRDYTVVLWIVGIIVLLIIIWLIMRSMKGTGNSGSSQKKRK